MGGGRVWPLERIHEVLGVGARRVACAPTWTARG